MAKSKGRDRQREARWRRILREQGRSGLGVREFCRRGKLTESAFYYWRRELQRRQEEPARREASVPPPRPTFVAVRVNEPSASPAGFGRAQSSRGRIEIEWSGGRRVHVIAPVDRQALADVLAVLATASPDGLEGQPSFAKVTEGKPC